MSRAATVLLSLVLLMATGGGSASAQARFGVNVHGDMGYWRPVPAFWGAGVTGAVDYIASEHVDLGGRLRYAIFPWRGEGTMTTRSGVEAAPSTRHHHVALSAAARFHGTLQRGTVSPYGEASVGLGVWNGCIRGDACGGIGALVGVGAGIEFPVSEVMSLALGMQLLLQTGLENGVDWFWIPGVTAGLRYTL